MSRTFWQATARIGVMLAVLQAQSIEAQGPVVGSPMQGRAVDSRRLQGQRIEDKPGSFLPLRRDTALTRVVGTVLTVEGLIVASAGAALLRNLVDGKVVGPVPVDQMGQFGLAGFAPGLYIAEVVDASGSIIATSPSFTVAYSQLVNVAPIVPAHPVTSFAYWGGNSAATAINTATSAGIISTEVGTQVTPRTGG